MNTKTIAIVLAIAIILVGVPIWYFMSQHSEKPVSTAEKKSVLVEEEIIPMVDDTVEVTLESLNDGKDLKLSIQQIPQGTTAIEYEMSYETEKQGLQGLIGTLELEKEEKELTKEVTAGTCSSGKCVYHSIISDVSIKLLFSGTYGERVFEKTYSVDQ